MMGQPATDTVAALLARRSQATPDATAFRTEAGDGRWDAVDWRAFGLRVAVLRRGLAAAGLRHGERLALIAPISLEWELLHHAALSMGAVVVGLDGHDLPERIAAMAKQAGISACAVAEPRALGRLDPQTVAGLRFLVPLGGAAGEAAAATLPPGPRRIGFDELEALGAASPAEPADPAGTDAATIIFTSGTTGAPKGIAYTHTQLCRTAIAVGDVFDFIGSDARLLCWLPLSNLFQRMVNLAAAHRGAQTWLLADPRRVMQAVAEVSPDLFVGVPRFYEKLHDGIRGTVDAQPALQRAVARWAWNVGRRAAALEREGAAPGVVLRAEHAVAEHLVLRRIRRAMGDRLRCMVTGSAPMAAYLLHEFHALGWVVLEAYGLSENVMPMAMNRIDGYRFGSVGRPLPGNEIAIASDGTIKVRGFGVFSGYWGEPGPGPVDADGYYTTGDLGRFDADGFLHLSGRSNDMIKTSTGRRVAPVGVEARLSALAEIDQAVLIGDGRKCLVALCSSTRSGWSTADQQRLQQALASQLQGVHELDRPLAIAVIDRPFEIARGELTPNLKIRRKAIETHHAALIDSLYRQVDSRQPTGRATPALLLVSAGRAAMPEFSGNDRPRATGQSAETG